MDKIKTRRQITTTIDSDLIREMKIIAAKSDMNLNDVIEEALRAYLENAGYSLKEPVDNKEGVK